MNRSIKKIYYCAIIPLLIVMQLITACSQLPMQEQNNLDVIESELQYRLFSHIDVLANKIGERNSRKHENLVKAAKYIEKQFAAIGGLQVSLNTYHVEGLEFTNIIAEKTGKNSDAEILIIGAHYDTAKGTVGANDNTTGVAALIEIARELKNIKSDRTVRLVAFVNEEPPYFQTEQMGSLQYAKIVRGREENVVGMISIETIGAYYNLPDSQEVPEGLEELYPSTANFIAFLSDDKSAPFLQKSVDLFKNGSAFPAEYLAASDDSGAELDLSDHWSFWEQGYQAIMITDTAFYRYPHYHKKSDTIDKINFTSYTKVVLGLQKMILELAIPLKK